ncbi:MAG: HAD family hydrolase, partial [SAR202 cluster bacterium]
EEAECYKPNPNIFKKFIYKNNLNPKDCWYVGDKEFDDVTGSSSLGMQPVLINRSVYNDLRYLDKYIQISDLRQLYEIIKSL